MKHPKRLVGVLSLLLLIVLLWQNTQKVSIRFLFWSWELPLVVLLLVVALLGGAATFLFILIKGRQ